MDNRQKVAALKATSALADMLTDSSLWDDERRTLEAALRIAQKRATT